MNVFQTLEFNNPPLYILSDEICLYLFNIVGNQLTISTVDCNSLSIIFEFVVQIDINLTVYPFLDLNFLYIPTNDGRIIVIDKFSGILHHTIDLGLMTPISQIKSDENCIYSLCGVPISHGNKTQFTHYVLCINNKLNGKKIFQSKSFTGESYSFAIQDSKIYFSINNTIRVFNQISNEENEDKKFQYLHEQKFKNNIKFDPILYNKQIIVFFDDGFVEVVNFVNEMNFRILFGKYHCQPIIINDLLYLFSVNKSIMIFNMKELNSKYSVCSELPNSNIIQYNNCIIFGDQLGNIKMHNDIGEIKNITVFTNPVKQIFNVGDCILATDYLSIKKICVNVI